MCRRPASRPAPTTTRLLPDAEVVYSPSGANFDVRGYVQAQPGFLAGYTEIITNTRPPDPGWKIVADYARRYSRSTRGCCWRCWSCSRARSPTPTRSLSSATTRWA